MSAGKAQLTALLQTGFYRELTRKTMVFVRQIRRHIQAKDYPVRIFSVGSVFWISFSTRKHVRAADEIDAASMSYFKILHHELLENSIYFGPSGYEVGFVSAKHTREELLHAADIINRTLDRIFEA
jgi:glutamate-1-semialdehyde 2,1-aminomutase